MLHSLISASYPAPHCHSNPFVFSGGDSDTYGYHTHPSEIVMVHGAPLDLRRPPSPLPHTHTHYGSYCFIVSTQSSTSVELPCVPSMIPMCVKGGPYPSSASWGKAMHRVYFAVSSGLVTRSSEKASSFSGPRTSWGSSGSYEGISVNNA